MCWVGKLLCSRAGNWPRQLKETWIGDVHDVIIISILLICWWNEVCCWYRHRTGFSSQIATCVHRSATWQQLLYWYHTLCVQTSVTRDKQIECFGNQLYSHWRRDVALFYAANIVDGLILTEIDTECMKDRLLRTRPPTYSLALLVAGRSKIHFFNGDYLLLVFKKNNVFFPDGTLSKFHPLPYSQFFGGIQHSFWWYLS